MDGLTDDGRHYYLMARRIHNHVTRRTADFIGEKHLYDVSLRFTWPDLWIIKKNSDYQEKFGLSGYFYYGCIEKIFG